MRKWVYKLAMMAALIAALWGALWVGIYRFCLHESQRHQGHGAVWISHNVNAAVQKRRLEQCSEPKVVILGGSNAGFGICSPLLQEHFGRPVFNTGNNGCVGLRMQLAMFEDYLNEEDLVIIMPEYHQFSDEFWGNLILCHVLCTDPDFVRKLSLYQAFKLSAFWGGWIQLARDDRDPDYGTSNCYSSAALNEYGDIALPREHSDFNAFWDGGFGRMSNYSFRYLASFMQRCKSAVILMPPALDKQSYQNLEPIIGTIHQRLADQGTPFAVAGRRYCWDDSLFFDSGYHLTSAAAEMHTRMLIQDIDSILVAHQKTGAKVTKDR